MIAKTEWYVQRQKAGKCGRCAHKLPDGYGFLVCRKCRKASQDRMRLMRTRERFKAIRGERPDAYESRKWASLEASMRFACERCGLRGEHQCIPKSASELANDRSGPGFTMPDRNDLPSVYTQRAKGPK